MSWDLISCRLKLSGRLRMICVLCTMVWYSLYVIFDNCLFIFSSENTMFSAGAIDFVIAGWPAGVSMVSSGTMGGEPESALSLPALCLRVNEDDVGCGGGVTAVEIFLLFAATKLWGISRCLVGWLRVPVVFVFVSWYRLLSATRFGALSSSGGLPWWASNTVEGGGDCLSECLIFLVVIRTLWLIIVSLDVVGISGSPGQ